MNKLLGNIVKVIDKDKYIVEVDVPGEGQGLRAFPYRAEVDEPRVGDLVWLEEIDPIYHSYYLYQKVKENNFIGFRARGKVIKLNEETIQIGVFDDDGAWFDDSSGTDKTPMPKSWIEITKDGNINIESAEITVNAKGNITVNGDNIAIKGASSVKVEGNTTITGGNLTVNGNVAPTGSGPFCGIKVCPFTGAPHVGNKVSGT